MAIKQHIPQVMDKGNKINVHCVPGHKDILDNELTNQQAKTAAHEVACSKDPVEPVFDKKEAITEVKRNPVKKMKAEIHAVREDR